MSGYYRNGCPDIAEMGVRMLPKYDWQTENDPGGLSMWKLLWCRCARASARFFFACGLPAPGSRHREFQAERPAAGLQMERLRRFLRNRGTVAALIPDLIHRRHPPRLALPPVRITPHSSHPNGSAWEQPPHPRRAR